MASTIAEAYVQILPSAEGISGNLTSELNKEGAAAGASAGSTASSSFGSKFSKGLATVGKVGAAALAASTTAVISFGSSAVTAGSEFDSAMSQVASTMGKTTDEIGDLRDFAQEMGSTTAFSATEAAEGLNILAMAGYEAEDQMSVLPGVLDLASAGGLSLADAADYTTGILAGFSNETATAGEVADLLATISSSAKGDVQSFGEGLSTVAGMATTTNQSMEDMTVALGILGNNNYSASEAGNALSRTLKNLYQPSNSAAEAMEALGVSAYTAEGEARPLQDVLKDLNNSLDGMSDLEKNSALSDVFDSATLKSVPALLNNADTAWDELKTTIENSNGAAKEMANTQLDNLEGDITLFKSALEGAKIAVSDELTPTLREFVTFGSEGLSQLTKAFKTDGMDGAVESFGTILTNGLTMITSKLPEVVTAGSTLLQSLITGITQNSSTIVSAAVQILNTLISTIGTSAPQLLSAGLQIVSELILGISSTIPTLIPTAISMLNEIKNSIITNLPILKDAAITLLESLASSITSNLGDLLDTASSIVLELSDALVACAPDLMTAAMTIITQLLLGLIDNTPQLVNCMISIRTAMLAAILDNLPELLQAGITIIGQYIAGVTQEIPHLIAMFPELIDKIKAKFTEFDWSSLGTSIIQGIKNGISSATGLIKDAAKAAAKAAYDSATSFLKVNSPSKLFRDDVGKPIPEGMALGIENNTDYITKAMDDLSDVTVSSINANNILKNSQKYSDSAELSTSGSIAEGTHIIIKESIDMGDTKLKEIVAEYVITKIGNETRAVRIAQGGYY